MFENLRIVTDTHINITDLSYKTVLEWGRLACFVNCVFEIIFAGYCQYIFIAHDVQKYTVKLYI